MLPSEFMRRATSFDVGLLHEYYAAQAEARKKASEEAGLMASADRNAVAIKQEL